MLSLEPNFTYIWVGLAALITITVGVALIEIAEGFWERRQWRRYKKSMQNFHEGLPALQERLAQQNQRQLQLISSRDADDKELFDKVEEYRNDFGGPGEEG
jgi:hypothetical protein